MAGASITSTLRDDLHWMLVRQRIDYKLYLFVFKCLHQLPPPYLSSMTVPLLAASIRRNLRSAGQGDLLVSKTKTVSFGSRSFAVTGPSTWNSLPTALKDPLLTVGQFCYRLKTEMFIRSYYTVSPQKTCDYIFYNIFNNRCPITIIFGIVISKSMCHRKMVSFPTSPI